MSEWWTVWFRDRLTFNRGRSARTRIGVALFVFALSVQPLGGLLAGRQWTQLEVFGVSPDPTAVATWGLLLAASRVNWLALVMPVLWCVLSGVTLSVLLR